ncbi:MAG TPA: hypothetical protein DCS93_41565 [Microscillaceae bacterium]|nr:hypothetical protein [Microscillaceae bacterium]
MTAIDQYKMFLTQQVPQMLEGLEADTKPGWGMMTAQHMLEHLAKITKSSIKSYGSPPAEPTEGQQKFKAFVNSGIPFRKNDSKKGKLDDLYYGTFEEAKSAVVEAVNRFFKAFEQNPDLQPYNPIMGALSFEELQSFHHRHFRHHFVQFGLLETADV